MLNSEPPSWILHEQREQRTLETASRIPHVVVVNKKSQQQGGGGVAKTLPGRIRKKISSSVMMIHDSHHDIINDDKGEEILHAVGFTTLHRRGSRFKRHKLKDDDDDAIDAAAATASTLRASRSTGNLLTSFRNRTNAAAGFGLRMSGRGTTSTRSKTLPSSQQQQQRQGASERDEAAPWFSPSPEYSNAIESSQVKGSERLVKPPPPTATTTAIHHRSTTTTTTKPRLVAKGAVSASASTRDLAEFLFDEGRGGRGRGRGGGGGGLRPVFRTSSDESKSSLVASTTDQSLTIGPSSESSEATAPKSTTGGRGGVRAAMTRFGSAAAAAAAGGRRRASLSSSISFQNLVQGPYTTTTTTTSSSSSQRPWTSSGIPHGLGGRNVDSGDNPATSPPRLPKKGKERPVTAQTVVSYTSSVYDPENKEAIEIDETLWNGMFGTTSAVTDDRGLDLDYDRDDGRRRIGPSVERDDESRSIGVFEFVEIDERESRRTEQPEPHRLGGGGGGAGAARQVRDRRSLLPSPRRKPVPLEEGDNDGCRVARSLEREDGARPSLVAMPKRVAVAAMSLTRPEQVESPTTPNETYSTPPATPSAATRESDSATVGTRANRVVSCPRSGPTRHAPSFEPRPILLVAGTRRTTTEATRENRDRDSDHDEYVRTIRSVVDELRGCMLATASTLVPESGTSSSSLSLEREIVPALRGLERGFVHGAKLIALVLERFDDDEARHRGGREATTLREGGEAEDEARFLVGALLE
ncbi:hypothetical protein JCM3766R1_003120 [Sporobolomyces carnicolor]